MIDDNDVNNQNKLFFGDNLDSMQYLLNNGYSGKINLIYIDPPYATSHNFKNKDQQHAYSDTLEGAEFVEFLRERLILMRELLASNGSIYLHLDSNMAFTMKLIMDEIFGEKNCRAFITRKKCSTKNYTRNTFGNISDYIMFYTKSDKYTWHRPFEPWELEKMIEQYPYIDKQGRRYKKVPIHAPGERNGATGQAWRGKLPPKGKHWQYTPDKLDELDSAGEIYWSSTGNPRRMVFCNPDQGIPIQDIWLNYRDSINQAQKTTGYPTEKNFDMLKLIIASSSNPNDLVMDCFSGSGTTLGAAFELNRNWIGMDNSLESIKAIFKRFRNGLDAYGDYVNPQKTNQQHLNLLESCEFSVLSNIENYPVVKDVLKMNGF
ncbi:DNA (cytosine-5-)-methyltransferase [Actinobacillus ureae ATCC 25976]|uniref:site-specific DNA-methyltransferase (adenine-specific) n=1 Tax=Actinobacillus ureae ATCC 25976 TaxID=887324 RepID=E8KG33_9PAST|nr:site-specific DNA-methyltransferase [Actinobacillus ureae]EFX92157.1 DNA (cytosine-5-)-methyltransferase [Actinobacillus ureae ATCC 25976]